MHVTALRRIDIPHGFEYSLAEVGRGWTKVTGPIKFELTDSYSQFANIHLSPLPSTAIPGAPPGIQARPSPLARQDR